MLSLIEKETYAFPRRSMGKRNKIYFISASSDFFGVKLKHYFLGERLGERLILTISQKNFKTLDNPQVMSVYPA